VFILGAWAIVLVVAGFCMIRFNAVIEKFIEDVLNVMYGEKLTHRFMMRTGKEAGYVFAVAGVGLLGFAIYGAITGLVIPGL
jgi:hypothetical protein